MGAVKETYLRLLDALQERGTAARVQPDPLPDDDELTLMAREVAAQLGAADLLAEIDDGTLADLRDAYNEGRQPGRLDFDVVVRKLGTLGVAAHVDHTSGDTATLYAGPMADWPDNDGVRRRAVSLGPGAYDGPRGSNPYGHTHELGYGDTDGHDDGVSLREDAQPTEVATRIAGAVVEVQRRRRRFDDAADTALAALWDAVAAEYPEVTTGDFGPAETMEIERAVRTAMSLWLRYNRPVEGIAPSKAAAQYVVAERRAGAVRRLTPMAEVVDRTSAHGLWHVVHHHMAASVHETLARRDFAPISKDVAFGELSKHGEDLLTHATTVADLVPVLVDLVGDYRAAKALVDAAAGHLCNAVDDGDICGARLDDAEGFDGKCGTHADRVTAERDDI